MSTLETRSIPELLENALQQASLLFSDEIALMRAEISEKAAMIGRGVALMAIGAMLVLPALVMILLAIAAALGRAGFEPWVANLATGAGALLLGAIFAWIGASRLSARRLAPRETLDEIRRDGTALREMAR